MKSLHSQSQASKTFQLRGIIKSLVSDIGYILRQTSNHKLRKTAAGPPSDPASCQQRATYLGLDVMVNRTLCDCRIDGGTNGAEEEEGVYYSRCKVELQH